MGLVNELNVGFLELPTNSKRPPTATLSGISSEYELNTITTMVKVKCYAKENTK